MPTSTPARVTLRDVCELTEMSQGTVSMILNGKQAHRFSPQTRDRVLVAARQLGYRVDRAAQMFRTGKTHNVAVLLNHLRNPFFGEYASLIQRGLREHGYDALPMETAADSSREREILEQVPSRGLDGVIDLQGMNRVADLCAGIAHHIPLVFRSSSGALTDAPADIVRVDYAAGMRLAADHLATTGRRRPGLVVVTNHLPGMDMGRDSDWTRTIRSAMADAGIAIGDDQWCGPGIEGDLPAWRSATRSFLTEHPEVDSLVVHNAATLAPVLQGVAEAGRTVGRDLAVVSFDDLPDTEFIYGGITVVHEPVERVARHLVAMFLKRIKNPGGDPMRKSISTQLKVRPSTQPAFAGRSKA